jgi:hypothetical protein
MPWEETDKTIRSGHRSPEDFQAETLKTISLNPQEGIDAIVGKPVGKQTMEIECYVFSKEKGWTPTELGRQPARVIHQYTVILNEIDRQAEEERMKTVKETKSHERFS